MSPFENPFTITSKDIFEAIKRNKRTIFFSSSLVSLLILAYVLLRPPLYKAEATFREKGKAQNDSTRSGLSIALLAGLNDNNENTALSLFRSRALIGAAIIQKNKQAFISNRGFQFSWGKNLYRNLQTEVALSLDKPYPFLAENDQSIEVQGLKYTAEQALKLKVLFLTDSAFEIILPSQEKLIGELGEPLSHEQFVFTLAAKGNSPLANRGFNLTLYPLQIAYEKVKSRLTVQSDNKDKGLLKLSYKDPNRKEASSFLNAILGAYQEHQRKEHERICKEQIAYLHNRQAEAGIFLEEMMVKHAQTMSLQGPTIDLLFQNQQGYLQKLLAIDLELQRLQSAILEGRVFYDSIGWEGGSPTVINQLLADIRTHKQHAEAIQMALRNQELPKGTGKRDLALREYQGIDLASATQLFLDYSARLNETEGEINHHQFLADHVQTPDFEVSSLSTVLKDPVSNELIQKAANANLLLQDQANRSVREQERLKSELALQKGVLKTHIEQTKDLLHLKKSLLQEKIWGLQNTQLDLIAQKVAVVEQQLQEYLKTRVANLRQERRVIEEQQALLRGEMLKLPSKWASEKMIEQHLETSKKMIEKIAEAVEAKNISAKLDLSQSAPLDTAIVPLHPQSPLTVLFVVLGALLGFFFSSTFVIARECLRGFPAREDNLKLQGQVYLGQLSTQLSPILNDKDLEILRRLSSHVSQTKVVALLLNQGPNYAAQLAELLEKGGRKAIILSCIFDGKEAEDQSAGLLGYLKGENLPKQAWIHSGGFTRYGKEALDSPRFGKLVEELKQECDCLLLLSRAPILSAEADTLSRYADQSVATLNGERLESLKPLFAQGVVFLEAD